MFELKLAQGGGSGPSKESGRKPIVDPMLRGALVVSSAALPYMATFHQDQDGTFVVETVAGNPATSQASHSVLRPTVNMAIQTVESLPPEELQSFISHPGFQRLVAGAGWYMSSKAAREGAPDETPMAMTVSPEVVEVRESLRSIRGVKGVLTQPQMDSIHIVAFVEPFNFDATGEARKKLRSFLRDHPGLAISLETEFGEDSDIEAYRASGYEVI